MHLSLTLVRMSASASRYIYSHLSFEFCGHLLSVLRRAACCCVLLFRCFMLFVIALIASTDWACFVVKLRSHRMRCRAAPCGMLRRFHCRLQYAATRRTTREPSCVWPVQNAVSKQQQKTAVAVSSLQSL